MLGTLRSSRCPVRDLLGVRALIETDGSFDYIMQRKRWPLHKLGSFLQSLHPSPCEDDSSDSSQLAISARFHYKQTARRGNSTWASSKIRYSWYRFDRGGRKGKGGQRYDRPPSNPASTSACPFWLMFPYRHSCSNQHPGR